MARRSEQAIYSHDCLKHGMEKKARLNNHWTFLIICHNHRIIPRGLTVKLPTSISNTSNIASKASFALFRIVIRNTRSKKVCISEEIDTSTQQLCEVLTVQQWQQGAKRLPQSGREKAKLDRSTSSTDYTCRSMDEV